jgi:hypothetical protein
LLSLSTSQIYSVIVNMSPSIAVDLISFSSLFLELE